MRYKNDPSRLWRSVQNVLDRIGIHPLVALAGILLLIFSPRLVLLVALVYAVYWMYQNGVFSEIPSSRRQGQRNGQGDRVCKGGGRGKRHDHHYE